MQRIGHHDIDIAIDATREDMLARMKKHSSMYVYGEWEKRAPDLPVATVEAQAEAGERFKQRQSKRVSRFCRDKGDRRALAFENGVGGHRRADAQVIEPIK